MIFAYQKDQDLVTDIAAKKSTRQGFHIWWLGQSGFLIQWQGKRILIDPYLSDSLTHKYAQTDKPHVRMSEQVVRPEMLQDIAVVTSSHNHTDHLDGETLIPLIQVNPDMKMIIPEANREFVANRIQQPLDWPIGLNDGQSVQVGAFQIHGIPAAHNELARDDKGQCLYMGYVFQFGPNCVYHSGDTLWREEIIDALKPFDIDLAILPINGNKPERRVAGNLDAEEAVRLAQTIGAKLLIPCHYHMFGFNTVEPDLCIELAHKNGQAIKIMQHGEGFHYLN